MTALVTNVNRPYSYNAVFEFAGNSFPVNMTRFSFSWAMAEKGRAQSRRHYTIYPYRVEQSKLTVELVFRDVGEYLDFWRFVVSYQQTAVSSANYQLRFKSYEVQQSKGGCDYGVALESVPFSVRHTDIAPKMQLVMFIMKDNFDYEEIGGSNMKGDEKDLAKETVKPSDVKQGGDASMATKTKKRPSATKQAATVKKEPAYQWVKASSY